MVSEVLRTYRRDYYRRYRAEHPESVRDIGVRSCTKHREKRLAYHRKRYALLEKVVPVMRKVICRRCGVEFSTVHLFKVYCTESCGKKYRGKPKCYAKVCPVCGIDFIAQRKDKVSCSEKCKRLLGARRSRQTPKGKIARRMQKVIGSMVVGGKGGISWSSLVGYDSETLKKHLEKKFRSGMTWENYGTAWHIDHKIPISAFNIHSYLDIDFMKCWSLKNLQPLWARENLLKSGKLEVPFQPSLPMDGRKMTSNTGLRQK